ncbi:dihydrodipicolinate reductase [Thiotrichales bacterium 19S11-10]|nr:dihydrodipicolinate reductase [Thiotrichales bacterium 19S11-10]
MKVAVIGKGKTGQAVIDLLQKDQISGIFDSKNKVTVEKLAQADIAIVFVNAQVFKEIVPILLSAKIPVISGVTGFQYDEELIQTVNNEGLTWVVAHNFSLSMVFIKEALSSLGKLRHFSKNAQYSLSETHHVQKLDKPSGTALSWQKWLDLDSCPIESIRKEDVKGEHQLKIKNTFEIIEFSHTALDRKLFAEGAVWSAHYIYANQIIKGFYQFDEIVKGAS